MALELEGIVVESAPKQIARRIREAILDGKIEPNERLPTEDELARQFGVSRATLREALKRLAAENLVESRRGASGGNFVKAPSRDDIRNNICAAIMVGVSFNLFAFRDFVVTRFQLSQSCCRLAAQARTEADLKLMRQEVALQRRQDISDVEFCASDVRFHCQIATATANPLLAASVTGVLQGLEPVMNLLLFRFRDREKIADQHDRLIAALERRDADGAVAVLQEQTDYLVKLKRTAERSHRQKHQADSAGPAPTA